MSATLKSAIIFTSKLSLMSVIIFGPNAKVIGYPILIVSRYCVVSSSIENAFSFSSTSKANMI